MSSVDLARWSDLQHEIRGLGLQRGLRFVAVAILAPFGVSGISREERVGPSLSTVVFGITLILLAIAELLSMVQSGLRAAERKALEERHPALAPRGKPSRLARSLGLVSGPGFSTALYALLGAAFIVGGSLPG